MIVRALAPAKVNLCLWLGPVRDDGRHQLVTLFQSLSLADELVLETVDGERDQVVCPGVDGDNLAAAALAGLRARGWDGPAVRISITKQIPVAAGMAGGSADAAATLRLAMALSDPTHPRAEEVDAIAAALGADVPSRLLGGLAVGTGAGELVEHYEPLAPHAYLVLPSPHALATADVYREADALGLGRTARELGARYEELLAALSPGARLADELIVNDLEPATLSLCPSIADGLAAVRDAGADRAIVCGSGPTVAGIFWGADAGQRALRAVGELGKGWPGAVAATPVSAEFASPSLG